MHNSVISVRPSRGTAAMPSGCLVRAACLLLLLALSASAGDGLQEVRVSFDTGVAYRQVTVSDKLGYVPNSEDMGLSYIDAFENHEYFVFVHGAARASVPIEPEVLADSESEIIRRVIFVRPHTFLVDDQLRVRSVEATIRTNIALQTSTHFGFGGDTENSAHFTSHCLLRNQRVATGLDPINKLSTEPGWVRTLNLMSLNTVSAISLPNYVVEPQTGTVQIEMRCTGYGKASDATMRLSLPLGPEIGHIEIVGKADDNGHDRRPLPSGILSPEPESATRRLQWDLPYKIEGIAAWDIQHPSSELRRAVESGELAPCRVVEFGCGTGNDAVYLASQGFEVTAIDISPTALAIAEHRAQEAKVNVQWLLADILQPPNCGPFDLVYDRGCYHEVRHRHAVEYVNAVRKLTRNGSKILILAGNANHDPHWQFEGPARVRAIDIRRDFSSGFHFHRLSEFRFDPAPSQRHGALAWSVLIEKLSNSPSHPR